MTLTPHTLLVPWSRKCRATPLLPLWVVRPIQSLSASIRAPFTFYFYASSVCVCVYHIPYSPHLRKIGCLDEGTNYVVHQDETLLPPVTSSSLE